jgi:hypothetical protein
MGMMQGPMSTASRHLGPGSMSNLPVECTDLQKERKQDIMHPCGRTKRNPLHFQIGNRGEANQTGRV